MTRNRVIVAILLMVISIVGYGLYLRPVPDTQNDSQSSQAEYAQAAIDYHNDSHRKILSGNCHEVFGDEDTQRAALKRAPILSQIVATLDGYCMEPTEADYQLIFKYLEILSNQKISDYAYWARNFETDSPPAREKNLSIYKFLLKTGPNMYIATALLGELYWKGLGVEKDPVKAQSLFKRAALGHAPIVFMPASDKRDKHGIFLTLYNHEKKPNLTFGKIAAEFGDPFMELREWPKPMQEQMNWLKKLKNNPKYIHEIAQNLWNGSDGYPQMKGAAYHWLESYVYLSEEKDLEVILQSVVWAYSADLINKTYYGGTPEVYIHETDGPAITQYRLEGKSEQLLKIYESGTIEVIPYLYCIASSSEDNVDMEAWEKLYHMLTSSEAPELLETEGKTISVKRFMSIAFGEVRYYSDADYKKFQNPPFESSLAYTVLYSEPYDLEPCVDLFSR